MEDKTGHEQLVSYLWLNVRKRCIEKLQTLMMTRMDVTNTILNALIFLKYKITII